MKCTRWGAEVVGRQGNGLRLRVTKKLLQRRVDIATLICLKQTTFAPPLNKFTFAKVWIPVSAPVGQWSVKVVTWVNNRWP